MRTWRLIVCVVAVGACGGPAQEPAAADLQRMRALESEIAAAIDEAIPQRIAALRVGVERIPPAGEGRPCPRELPPLEDDSFAVHRSVLERRQLQPDYDLREDTRRGQNSMDRLGMIARRVGYGGSRIQGLSNVHSSLERKLAEGGWQMGGDDPFAFYTSWRERLDWELVIVADVYRAPLHDSTSFNEGVILGRALLYDFAENEVVCSARIDASSSEEVFVRFDPSVDGLRQNQALLEDLHDNAFRQARERLRAVEPTTALEPADESGDEPATSI